MSVLTVIRNAREAAPLARWGARFARSRDVSLTFCVTIFDDPERETCDVDINIKAPAGERPEEAILSELREALAEDFDTLPRPELAVRLCFVADGPKGPVTAVLDEIEQSKAELLLVGIQREEELGGRASLLGRQLFHRAPCRTVLLRLGSSDGRSCQDVLVPLVDDKNSRVALRLGASSLAAGERLTPLIVEHPSEELAHDVGLRMIQRALERAEVRPDDGGLVIEPRVEAATSTEKAIATAAADGYDLVLIGASDIGAIRQTLFGTVPERLLMGENGAAVAIVRGPLPVSLRLRDRFERWLHLTVPQLEREDRIALHERLHSQGRWNFDFLTLIALSTAIAALGLLADSSAVVIGAMLVAPLMTPLLGGGLALVQGNAQLFVTAAKAIVAGFVVALAIGAIAGAAVPIDRTTEELLRRGFPNLLDLGVAFFSGIAAAYCVGRPNLSAALPGVAIAAALVPPIATSGITLARDEIDVAIGAGLLFGTNVVAVMLGAAISFYGAGIRGAGRRRWAIATVLALCLVIAVLSVPLAQSLVADVIRPGVGGLTIDDGSRQEVSSVVEALGGRLSSVSGFREDGEPVVELTIEAAEQLPASAIEQLRGVLVGEVGQPVSLRVKTLLVQKAFPPGPHDGDDAERSHERPRSGN